MSFINKNLSYWLVLAVTLSMQTAMAAALPYQRNIEFRELGVNEPIQLLGVDTEIKVPFGIRLDEVVTRGRLRLKANLSPALLPRLSHLNVRLNGEFVGTIQVDEETRQLEIDQWLDIDPRLFSDYNQLGLQLIGHYTLECEDAAHSSLWAQISPDSEFELELQPLNVKAGLSVLPAPFFDERDNRRLELPFVLPANIDASVIKSAGILASWFGNMAAYRGARFPVQNSLPEQHAVVLATNDDRPSWLSAVKAPTVSIVSLKDREHIKFLVVQGKDAGQLRQAILGLVYGHPVMTGLQAEVERVESPPLRELYDVPKWIRTDRKVRLGEVVDAPINLQVQGHRPQPIRINARIPPDLYTGFYEGVDLDLKYRYTQPLERDNSSLSVLINQRFVQSYRLQSAGDAENGFSIKLPLFDTERFLSQDALLVPAFLLGSDNQIQFQFGLDYHSEGRCKDTPTQDVFAAIDPDSTIDLTGFPHYAPMPNLALFANAGYPFTRYADLSKTVFVLPDTPGAKDVEAMLFLLARFASMTGVTATAFSIEKASEVTSSDADMLLIGTDSQLTESSEGSRQSPLLITKTRRHLNIARGGDFENDSMHSLTEPVQVSLVNRGALGALVGYESPFSKDRSVIAITGNDTQSLSNVLQALSDPGRISHIRGSVSIVADNTVHSIDTGKTYAVGSLSWWQTIWLHFSLHPGQLSVLGILAGLLMAIMFFMILRSIATMRVKS